MGKMKVYYISYTHEDYGDNIRSYMRSIDFNNLLRRYGAPITIAIRRGKRGRYEAEILHYPRGFEEELKRLRVKYEDLGYLLIIGRRNIKKAIRRLLELGYLVEVSEAVYNWSTNVAGGSKAYITLLRTKPFKVRMTYDYYDDTYLDPLKIHREEEVESKEGYFTKVLPL